MALLSNGVETGVELDVTEGTVTLDGNAANRGRCDLTVMDDGSLGLIPKLATDALTPYGNEVRVERGIRYPEGTTELVSLGVFRIQSVDVADTGAGLQIQITGLDRSARVVDARFESAFSIAGTNPALAIETYLLDVNPATTFGEWIDVGGSLTLRVGEEGGDRWAFLQTIATDYGLELFFDGDGDAVLRPITTTSDDPTASLVEGEGGLLLEASRSWVREGTYNRVIATGEAPADGVTPAARGVATDSNGASPTYYYGPFGKVPRFYTGIFENDAQAATAAAGILIGELGTTQTVSFGSVVNPALEPGDVVQITRARTGIDELHIVDSVTIPLGADAEMSGATRAVVVFS